MQYTGKTNTTLVKLYLLSSRVHTGKTNTTLVKLYLLSSRVHQCKLGLYNSATCDAANLLYYLSSILLFPPCLAMGAQLTVTPLPNVLFQNNSGVHNIVEQSVIWLYCTANSTNATITWTKNGVTLVNDPTHIRIRSSSSGVSTTSSLVVDNFQSSDNGSYVCQGRDGVLTMNSSTLSLTGRCGYGSTVVIM